MRSWLTSPTAVRVADVGVTFWVLKALSTALGESTSDYSVHAIVPELAVLLGFAAFVAALVVQFRMQRYVPWAYWLAVAMVGVFGTMAADVLHVGLGVPYAVSTILYAAVLAVVFIAWRITEPTLAFHSITTPRREAFYWAAVVATFAMGTALGDVAAYSIHLGYFVAAAIFAVLIAVPALAYAALRSKAVLCFWAAYVLTRPLGASLADGFGKPRAAGGLGIGAGVVAVVLALVMVLIVASLSFARRGHARPETAGSDGAAPRMRK